MTLAIIDADIVLYQSASIVEVATDWGDDRWTLHADAREAKIAFDGAIASIVERVKASKTVLCFSAKNNWRAAVLPEYKANRVGGRKPICFPEVKRYALAKYDCMIEGDLEADDCIGLVATGPKSRWRGCKSAVVVSEDKDLKSIPGTLYNPRTGEIQTISKEQADRFHLYQTLVGDSVDNYKGCPGVGPVTAGKILDKDPTWDGVVKAYEECGSTEEEALTQARVARILRHREYNFRTKEIILWKPRPSPSRSKKSPTAEPVKCSAPDPSGTPE